MNQRHTENDSTAPGNYLLRASGIKKSAWIGKREIPILKGVDFQIGESEFVAIVGPSGAGKSTLLHLLGTLEKPTEGEIWINGTNTLDLTGKQKALLRRTNVGFVFQFHHLLPGFTALENAAMPALINGAPKEDAYRMAHDLLSSFGLSERTDNKPAEMSGGEQQRVAVARAMINKPSLLLADEPTGNLDRATGQNLETDLIAFAREKGTAVVVVTHNEEWAAKADRVLTIVDGRIKTGS